MREKVVDYFAGHLLIPQPEFERLYRYEKDILKLKHHFRVSYQAILSRLAEMKLIDYGAELAKIRSIYKNRHATVLKQSMEIEPILDPKDFPENIRFNSLVWQALDIEEITETTAAELLNMSLEELGKERINRQRQDSDIYTILEEWKSQILSL